LSIEYNKPYSVRIKKIQQYLTLTTAAMFLFLGRTNQAQEISNANHSPLVESPSKKREGATSPIDGNQESQSGVSNFLDLVTVGDPFNAPDDLGVGAVDKIYQIGTYEVTARQYKAFLNAVAWKEDPRHLYHLEMESDKKIACIHRNINSDGTYSYNLIDELHGDLPITYISLNDAERFCNWLENGAPDATQDYQFLQQSTEFGAYAFSEQENQTIVESNPNARYHIPSDDEWVKAAYYKGNGINAGYWMYPTQHDTAPGNGLGDITNFANYQTYNGSLKNNFLDDALMITTVGCFNQTSTFYQNHDMAGNVAEWTLSRGPSEGALVRGGSWQSKYSWYGDNDLMRRATPKSYDPSTATNFIGFRIAVRVSQSSSVTENRADQSSSLDVQEVAPTAGKELGSNSAISPQEKALLTAVLITAGTLAGSSLMFITGEIIWDYFLAGMSMDQIAATFPTGRVVSIISHLAFNTYAMVKAEQDINAKNKN